MTKRLPIISRRVRGQDDGRRERFRAGL